MNLQESSQRQSLFICEQFGSVQRRLKARSFLWTSLLSLIVLLALPNVSFAQSPLTDDANTSTAPKSTDTNFGTNPNLNVFAAGNVYLKFKLTSTLPANTPGSVVERATLKLYIGNIMTGGKLDMYAVAAAWDEGVITANNAPPLGGLVTTTTQIGEDKRGKFLVIDITALVRQWLGDDGQGTNGLPNNGLALVAHPVDATTPAVANITFDSKENSQTSHEAQLNIQLKGTAGQQGPPGPQGEPGPQGVKGLNWQGVWNAATNYLIDDAVSYLGSSWRAKRANTNVTPVENDDWTIVAQKGNDGHGGGTVTGVSADGPLSVNNPTTTPNISLGIVPTAKGGTGLSSSGAVGNFLRSDGGAWTSTPLTAPDIPAGSPHYIHNSTSQQPSANFNIDGNGVANIVDATTQFNIAGSRILSNAGANNVFAGVGAGAVNTASENSFFGRNAGFSNTTGDNNAFFGNTAGGRNTTGGRNSFFGSFAGSFNSTGNRNSFFGVSTGNFNTEGSDNSFYGFNAGLGNTTGSFNAFFGTSAGLNNLTASGNSFFGTSSGFNNTTGQLNSFFGEGTGSANTTGTGNTFIGRDADFNTPGATGDNNTLLGANTRVVSGVSNSTAIGAGAVVSTSNTVVLGGSADTVQVPGSLNVSGTFGANILNATTQFDIAGSRILSNAGNNNLFAGRDAGASNTTGGGNSFFGASSGLQNSAGFSNSFFGSFAGFSNTAGDQNSFFGNGAGFATQTGSLNSFFGFQAGTRNTTGGQNSFFGNGAGVLNATGFFNSGFGAGAGANNSTGDANSYFGERAGLAYKSGSFNSFFGRDAGGGAMTNLTGNNISLIGANTNVGADNLSFATAIGAGAIVNASNTVVLGRNADTVQVPGGLNVSGTFGANILNAVTQYNLDGLRILSDAGTENLFVGVNAGASNTTGFNNSFFGHSAGQANTTACCNSFFGTFAGQKTTSGDNSFFGRGAGFNTTTGEGNSFFGKFAGNDNTTGSNNVFIGVNSGNPSTATQVSNSVAIGSNAAVSTSNTIVLGTTAETTRIPGKLLMGGGPMMSGNFVAQSFSFFPFSGIFTANLVLDDNALNNVLPSPVHLCIRTTFLGGGFGGEMLSRCTTSSSSVTDKTDVQAFSGGLDVINRLKPVSFKWKGDGQDDFGLNAEDVAEVEPLFVTRNDKGEVEDVKEGSLNAVFVNAFKEQQRQIEQQRNQLQHQQQQLDALKKLVCQSNPQADVCK